MKPAYLETITSGLVPARLIRRFTESPAPNVVFDQVELEITQGRGAYKKGMRVETLAHHFVNVTRRTQFNTFVTPVRE